MIFQSIVSGVLDSNQIIDFTRIEPIFKSITYGTYVKIEFSRQSFSLQGALRPKRMGALAEAFLVVGAPADADVNEKTVLQTGLQPQVLHCFPPEYDLSKLEVSQFCFPAGLQPKLIRRSASESGLNSYIYGSLTKLEESNNSFVILLTTEDCLLYGFCVHNDELLRSAPSFAEQRPWKPKTRELNHIVAPKCYCILSRFPFFQLHFDILYSLLARDRLYRIENSMAQQPFPPLAQNECTQLLQQFFAQPVPRESQALTIKLPNEIRALTFSCEPGHEDKLIVDRCLGAVFKLLPLDTVLALLAAVLQEYQIVLVSSHISVLSAISLSIIPLVKPFIWQGTFIPIVPRTLAECLQAPVPFIMGVDSISAHQISELPDAVILDIDYHAFLNLPPKMESLPRRGDLYEQLSNQLVQEAAFTMADDHRVACLKQPFKCSQAEIDCLHEIVDALRDYYHPLIDRVMQAQTEVLNQITLVDDGTLPHPPTIFDALGDDVVVDKICSMLTEEERPFIKRLLESQHYRFYAERIHPHLTTSK